MAGFESAAVAVYLSASFSWTGDSRQLVCSLRCGVLLSLGDLADDARVAGQGSLGLVERVGVRGDELSLVVGAIINRTIKRLADGLHIIKGRGSSI